MMTDSNIPAGKPAMPVSVNFTDIRHWMDAMRHAGMPMPKASDDNWLEPRKSLAGDDDDAGGLESRATRGLPPCGWP